MEKTLLLFISARRREKDTQTTKWTVSHILSARYDLSSVCMLVKALDNFVSWKYKITRWRGRMKLLQPFHKSPALVIAK